MSSPLGPLQRIRAGGHSGPRQPAGVVVPGGRRFVRRPADVEVCELCGEPVPESHSHLVNLDARALMCSCRPCYLLFDSSGAGGGRIKAVTDRVVALPRMTLTRPLWSRLQIPVNIAFFFENSDLGRICAFYPGPAGATESLLSLEVWHEVTAEHVALRTVQPDVEAVLLRNNGDGIDAADIECFIVPIDRCYELVGRLRQVWRGFDGGSDAATAIAEFFATVRATARPVAPAGSAG